MAINDFEVLEPDTVEGEYLLDEANRDNPFITDILRMLKSTPDELKIYDLLAGVDKKLMEHLVDTADYNLATFRKNFWLMNALYQLQDQLLEEDVFLSIGQVSVNLAPGGAVSYQYLSDHSDHKLKSYYLDWNNYQDATIDEVDRLISSFWEMYSSNDKKSDALLVLGLEAGSDWNEVQQRYRELASQHHPDKGGDSAKFIEVREAYEILSQAYQF